MTTAQMHVVSYHDDIYVVVGKYDREDCDVKVYRALDHAEAAAQDMIKMFAAKSVRVYRVFADSEDDPARPFPEWLSGQQLHEQIDRLDFDEVPTAA
jgi:hypothetical protein